MTGSLQPVRRNLSETPAPPPVHPLLAIYIERRPSLVRAFAARLGSMAAAEDLAQDLYLRVAATDPNAVIDNPSAWLFRMGTNLMLDGVRQSRRAAGRDARWIETDQTRLGAEAIVDGPPADEVVAGRQRLAEVAAIVEAMPPRMRRAFQLHRLNGQSQAQTARAMGISVSAVEKHVASALKLLLERLS